MHQIDRKEPNKDIDLSSFLPAAEKIALISAPDTKPGRSSATNAGGYHT